MLMEFRIFWKRKDFTFVIIMILLVVSKDRRWLISNLVLEIIFHISFESSFVINVTCGIVKLFRISHFKMLTLFGLCRLFKVL